MKRLSIPLHLVLLSCFLAIAAGPAAAEKKTLAYKKAQRVTISEVKMSGGDGRELVQGVYSDGVKSSDSEWDGIEERVFDQSESIEGNGTHRGTSVDIFRSGDRLFQRYSGTHKTTGSGDAWETTYQGVAEIVGGTGKYKNAKGRIQYNGKITPQGVEEQDSVELE